MSSSDWPLFRLRVAADADPGALARVLERFQNLNIVPRRVVAELATTGTLHVQVDLAGLPEETVMLIAAKLGQVPCIVNVHWHRS
jgi:hypothetical protein